MAENEKKPTGLFVPHTHWDREWRYPLWKNRLLLAQFMEQLLDVLENDPEYECFVLDGQSVAIEDYLEVCPENAERLARQIRAGRIAIGPWYTLPDLYPLDGECLVRNLLKGIRFSEKLGGCLRMGYNSFGWGQTAQFPQIYAGFGFDFIIAAKRVSHERAPRCEFWWESPDGTRVLTTRLGPYGRAGGFFYVYIPIRYGMPYDALAYRFDWGKTGIVYHRADAAYAHDDYFRVDVEQRYREEKVRDTVEEMWRSMDETTVPDFRLLLTGCDFTTPQPILTRIIREANAAIPDKTFRMGTLEEYARELHRRIEPEKVPVVHGELRDGPASFASANALATRMPIKQRNKEAENVLLHRAEPLASVLAMLGGEYPRTFLDIAWKYLLQSHPHDSLNGVTQDKTVEDTLNRLAQAIELGEVVHEDAVARLFQQIDLSRFSPGEQLLLEVNPLPHPVRDVRKVAVDTPLRENVWEVGVEDPDGRPLDVQFVSRQEMTCPVNDLEARPWPFDYDRHTVYVDTGEIPACGYAVLRVVPKTRFRREVEWWPETRTSAGHDIAKAPTTLENEFLRVEVQADGTFHLTDKARDRTVRNTHYFEDTGDVGDYWVYFAPYNNKTFVSTGCPARIWLEDNGPLSATLAVEISLEVPARARIPERSVRGESRRSDDGTRLKITSWLTLKRGARRLDIRTRVENTAEDHRLRVMIPTDIQTDYADAAGHFTVDRRPIIPPRDETGAFYPEMQTLPQQTFVDVSDGQTGLAVVNNCLTEYQLLDDARRTLALTLFRAVRNRICTEERATGNFPHQKGGQLLQTLEYEYALYTHEGDWDRGAVYREAQALNVPPAVFQISPHDKGDLPLKRSFFSITPETLILSALKKAEDRDSFIVRIFNPTNATVQGAVTFPVPPKKAFVVNLNEARQEELPLDGTPTIQVSVGTKKILTLEIEVQ